MPYLLDSPEAGPGPAAMPPPTRGLLGRHRPPLRVDVPWDTVCDWEFDTPRVRWFDGAELNITANCLDRHVAAGHGDLTAILWEPNDPADPTVSIPTPSCSTACRFANVLKARGVKKGDRVALYLPMVPELPWRCSPAPALARCTAWSSPGSPPAASPTEFKMPARCASSQRRHERGAKGLGLKAVVDQALAECPTVTTNLVVRHTGEAVDWTEGRDIWLHDALTTASADARRSGWPRRICSSSTPPAARASPRAWSTPAGATWCTPATASPTSSSTSRGCVLVHRGHRLDHRPQLHRLRTDAQRRHDRHVRGRPDLALAGPLSGRSARS